MVTPQDLLVLAERLGREKSEVEHRAAVSRAYYAAFLHLRQRLEARGLYQRRRSGADHRGVGEAASAFGEPTRYLLWTLRQRRNQADYDIDDRFAPNRVPFALLCAHRLLSL